MSNQSVLTSENVEKLFQSLLVQEGEQIPDKSNSTTVRGITVHVSFRTTKIAKHKEEIRAMLNELPKQFRGSHGGGWTFLNMVTREDGSQWGEQRQAEWLLLMGIAASLVKYLMPREDWDMFPGGMPYLVYRDILPKEQEEA